MNLVLESALVLCAGVFRSRVCEWRHPRPRGGGTMLLTIARPSHELSNAVQVCFMRLLALAHSASPCPCVHHAVSQESEKETNVRCSPGWALRDSGSSKARTCDASYSASCYAVAETRPSHTSDGMAVGHDGMRQEADSPRSGSLEPCTRRFPHTTTMLRFKQQALCAAT